MLRLNQGNLARAAFCTIMGTLGVMVALQPTRGNRLSMVDRLHVSETLGAKVNRLDPAWTGKLTRKFP